MEEATAKTCLAVEARMTHLTNWINHPRLTIQVSSSIHEPGNITLKEEFIETFAINDNVINYPVSAKPWRPKAGFRSNSKN